MFLSSYRHSHIALGSVKSLRYPTCGIWLVLPHVIISARLKPVAVSGKAVHALYVIWWYTKVRHYVSRDCSDGLLVMTHLVWWYSLMTCCPSACAIDKDEKNVSGSSIAHWHGHDTVSRGRSTTHHYCMWPIIKPNAPACIQSLRASARGKYNFRGWQTSPLFSTWAFRWIPFISVL